MTTTTATITSLSYPKGVHLFLLQNTGIIEQGSLTDAVTATVFTALHERIAQKLERRLWQGACKGFSKGHSLPAIHFPHLFGAIFPFQHTLQQQKMPSVAGGMFAAVIHAQYVSHSMPVVVAHKYQ